MDQPIPPQPPPSSSTSENPVTAIGRKVKSALSTHQQPSVRILRESKSIGEAPASRGTTEKPLPHLPPPAGADRPPPEQEQATHRFASAGKRAGTAIRSLFQRDENHTGHETFEDEYDTDTVDLLDILDPEVSTLATLTNVQNSLFVPSLGRFLDRRPVYRVSDDPEEARTIDKLKASLKRLSIPAQEKDGNGRESRLEMLRESGRGARTSPAISTPSSFQYAVLPDNETLRGWTQVEKEELDDHVRHMLHSRRARGKRAMKGFLKYVRRPLGLFITTYATLITLFGAAWVLFLIGWISIGSKRDYVINIVDNVLVALFAIIGDGLAPFRAVDTYHMIYIVHYHRKTFKKRKKLGLPELVDRNDLPDQRKEDVDPAEVDLESLIARRIPRGLARRIAPRVPKRLARRIATRSKTDDPSYEYSVLTEEEQAKLEYHERKFSKSHTFYKPHETETHFAFPLKLLFAIVVLLDCHSALQISLGACTWGIPYKTRPFALTTVILCFSITCNIMGGVLISIGDKRTRKKDVIERMMRQELTTEVIQEMETRWMKEAEERGDIDKSVRKEIEEERNEAESEEIKRAWKVVPSLPKTLLGKGEDHRQPSLPQNSRRSNSASASTASVPSTTKKAKSRSNPALQPVQEDHASPSRPEPALRKDEQKEGVGQKVLRLVRRADLDRS